MRKKKCDNCGRKLGKKKLRFCKKKCRLDYYNKHWRERQSDPKYKKYKENYHKAAWILRKRHIKEFEKIVKELKQDK